MSGRVASKTSVTNCLDHMLASTRAKVTELHADYGDKPIILVGIGTGAMLACQVQLYIYSSFQQVKNDKLITI